jgi:hypothetical protein
MACTGLSSCGCNACAPANTIYRGTCTDPGTQDYLTYLSGLDTQFCTYRLAGAVGLLTSQIDGSGNYQITFTEDPIIDLPEYQAVIGIAIPDLVVIDGNNSLLHLLGPAVANQILKTNAAGEWVIDAIPAATVPDPLVIGTLSVTVGATLPNTTITGTLVANGLAAGTPTSFLGVDAGGNVLTQTVGTAVPQVAYFFESPTSPGGSYPNSAAASGSNLIIGNLLYDSGGAIVTVTTSQTLTVAQAGKYTITWGGQVANINTVQAAIQLVINGITVSNGGVNPNRALGIYQRGLTVSCSYSRTLAVGDTIQLQLTANAGNETYEVWLAATKLSS